MEATQINVSNNSPPPDGDFLPFITLYVFPVGFLTCTPAQPKQG